MKKITLNKEEEIELTEREREIYDQGVSDGIDSVGIDWTSVALGFVIGIAILAILASIAKSISQ